MDSKTYNIATRIINKIILTHSFKPKKDEALKGARKKDMIKIERKNNS